MSVGYDITEVRRSHSHASGPTQTVTLAGSSIELPLSRSEACDLPKAWTRAKVLSTYTQLTGDRRPHVHPGEIQLRWWDAYVKLPRPTTWTATQAARIAAAKASVDSDLAWVP